MSHRWPLHPLPYPQESLSSWLEERQASSYGYRSDDVLIHDLGFPTLSSEELDTAPPAQLLARLAQRSGISVKRLSAMTLQGWVPQFIDSLEPGMGGYPAYARAYELLYPIELAYQCDPDEKSRVRGRVLIAQEHQPSPPNRDLHVSVHPALQEPLPSLFSAEDTPNWRA